MVSQAVIAITPEEYLSDILSNVHGAGLGHNARVLRPRRSPLREQLRRAGIPVEQAPRRIDEAECLLLIMAAARSTMAADLVLQSGASAIWTVAPSGHWSMVDDRVVSSSDHPAAIPPITVVNAETPDAPGTI